MCFPNIKNISDIYYSINWDNLHNKTNYILVENEPIREINLNIVMSTFLNWLKWCIVEFDNARHIHISS